ncbi:hypothetical protein [Actibacterium sp. XHP0104]|uniref:hypothetical protein n=1 Tax=Actibacterium sp. XHP0104 TaxID=2984335 RepID=UPI0021E88F33|nr:hypothetical protein [Actibacterium sp. XHP0104]MCV2883034.1 hypothetical protein [Actibacterium sp. XHP0104]
MRRFLILAALPLFLAACTAEKTWAPEEQVQAARYRHPGPAKLTLYTMLNNRTNAGGHSGLMISGSQRVMFDPAGTWWHRAAPERNDVHFGFTPVMEHFYVDYHARETYRVVVQELEVSPEVAEAALRLVQENGAVSKAMCSNATSGVLSRVPGLGPMRQTFAPRKLMDQFGALPGVKTHVIYDDDDDENGDLLVSQQIDPVN